MQQTHQMQRVTALRVTLPPAAVIVPLVHKDGTPMSAEEIKQALDSGQAHSVCANAQSFLEQAVASQFGACEILGNTTADVTVHVAMVPVPAAEPSPEAEPEQEVEGAQVGEGESAA